jgi:hypothetical protein
LSATLVRLLAYVGGIAALAIAAANLLASPAVIAASEPAPRPDWIEVERPHPAFALSIPEAADAPSGYAIRRHVSGGGRKDILSLGEPRGSAPYLFVEIHRPGSETEKFGEAATEIAARAGELGLADAVHGEEPAESKFGPLAVVKFTTTGDTPRNCLGFVRAFGDPRLQISGWFCQAGENFIERNTLTCALDRLTLLAAGSDPKVGALFAQAELARNFCGQRSTLLAPTPKHRALWTAMDQKLRGRLGQ